MSYISRVESWIADLKRRMDPLPEESHYYQELKARLREYETLLEDLRARHTTRKPREPGQEGD